MESVKWKKALGPEGWCDRYNVIRQEENGQQLKKAMRC